MTLIAEPVAGNRPRSLALRFALRELRGGLRGFYVFIACIALGVMAIAGVGSVAASLGEGLAREGRNLLGGDIAFVLFQREAKPQELAFLCGKHLASYRGEHYIRTLFPTQAELTIMLFARAMIAQPSTPMPPDIAKQVETTARELAKYMEPVQMEGLRTVVKRFLEEGAKANIRRWSHAVEMTACRAGLLVSGDLEIAKKILAAEPTLPATCRCAR